MSPMSDPLLRIIVEHQVVNELALTGPTTLGRSQDNDVVLDDRSVSQHHARIERGSQGWCFLDLGSSNGSSVAAGPVLKAGDSLPLTELTQIKLGATVIEFRPGEGHGASPPTAAQQASTAAHLTDELAPASPPAELSPRPQPSQPSQPPQPPQPSTPLQSAQASQPREPESLHPRVVIASEQGTRTVPLSMPRALLGRAPGCDVVLDHPSVSGRHAELCWDGGRFTLADLGSTNGTRIGLVRVTEAAFLTNGNHLILGAVDLLFVHDGPLATSDLDAEGLLDWLRKRRKISRQQAESVLSAHRSEGLSVEELLVSRGALSPGALGELRHNAGRRLMGLSDAPGSRFSAGLPWLLLFLSLAALVVVFVLR